MRKTFPILILSLTFLNISCKKELVPQESFVDYSKSNTTNNTNTNTNSISQTSTPSSQPVINPNGKANPPHGQPGHICGPTPQASTNTNPVTITNANTVLPITSTNTVAIGKGMNPSHGQPGHRCDIPVGAPLNSKPKTPTTQTTSVANNNPISGTPAVLSPNTTNTVAGTNPPHGQPGHVCGPAPATTTTETAPETKKE